MYYLPLLTIPCVSVIINKTLKLKTDPVQLGDAPHGVLHQPPRHPADGYLPEVAPPMEENPCKGFSLSLPLKYYMTHKLQEDTPVGSPMSQEVLQEPQNSAEEEVRWCLALV